MGRVVFTVSGYLREFVQYVERHRGSIKTITQYKGLRYCIAQLGDSKWICVETLPTESLETFRSLLVELMQQVGPSSKWTTDGVWKNMVQEEISELRRYKDCL